jgi:prolyl-tRNA synthetase
MAAAVEQYADDAGISWPRSLAPWDVHLVALGLDADPLYEELRAAGLDTIYDDRPDAGAGQKFADAELVGCPLRVTAGKRSQDAGEYEVQVRRGQEQRSVPLDEAAGKVAALWETLP